MNPFFKYYYYTINDDSDGIRYHENTVLLLHLFLEELKRWPNCTSTNKSDLYYIALNFAERLNISVAILSTIQHVSADIAEPYLSKVGNITIS